MIDGIKAILKDNLDEIRNNPLLEFKKHAEIILKTGEIEEERNAPIAFYKSLLFIDKGSVIIIRGSIHKLHNAGKHNYNSFGLSEIFNAINELADDLKIIVTQARLSNIEFGVNLIVPFEPRIFLNSIIHHKGSKFTYQIKPNMQYKKCEHQQYIIKVYDKGLQYGTEKYILRFELKSIKMEKINGFGITYLSDLLEPKKLEKLKIELLRVYDEMLIGDITVNPGELSDKDAILFANGHNDNYWDSKLPRASNYKKGAKDKAYVSARRSYYREISNFRELLKLTGANHIQLFIRRLIESESARLIEEVRVKTQSRTKKCHKLTAPKKSISFKKMSQIDRITSDKQKKDITVSTKQTVSQIDSLVYSSNNDHIPIHGNNKCKVTGLDISMQKENSQYLCTEGVRFYKKYYPEIYLKLWQRLSEKWHGCSEDVQIQEIHHSVRNEYTNPIHNTRRSIDKLIATPALFNQLDLISKEKLRIAGLAS